MRASMIEPRCLIEDDGRPCLLRDDFAIGENGFIGYALAPIGRLEKRKPRLGVRGFLLGEAGDSLTIDNWCGHGKLRFMAKKKISSTDLIWIFHERLKAFDDHPLHGIPIAIVPV